jgi:Zn-finger nucleic acid-binding protein
MGDAMLLTCLKCTFVLDKARIEDIEVDVCPACQGLWLDHGEVERISRKMHSEVDRLRRMLSVQVRPPAVPSEVQKACPSCTSAVNEVMMGAIHIDYCTRCKGVFLDRGELDAAIAAVTETKMTVPQIIAAATAEIPIDVDV